MTAVRWSVEPGKLARLLEIVSRVLRCDFSEWDEDAIRFGLRGTDAGAGRWYPYELYGQEKLRLCLAYDLDGQVVAETVVEGPLGTALSQVLVTSDQEIAADLRRAFEGVPRPDRFTVRSSRGGPDETDLYYEPLLRGRTWDTLSCEDMEQNQSLLAFLGAEGARYWLPALLGLCLSPEHPFYRELILGFMGRAERLQLLLPVEERAAVVRFFRHLDWWRQDLVQDSPEFRVVVRVWRVRELD